MTAKVGGEKTHQYVSKLPPGPSTQLRPVPASYPDRIAANVDECQRRLQKHTPPTSRAASTMAGPSSCQEMFANDRMDCAEHYAGQLGLFQRKHDGCIVAAASGKKDQTQHGRLAHSATLNDSCIVVLVKRSISPSVNLRAK
jgi:hypothetical protein